MRGLGVVQDGPQVVKIGADLRGGDRAERRGFGHGCSVESGKMQNEVLLIFKHLGALRIIVVLIQYAFS